MCVEVRPIWASFPLARILCCTLELIIERALHKKARVFAGFFKTGHEIRPANKSRLAC